ncbi:exodeoxyribonuclease V subunit gamma [Shewanella corallii]|uniref:RecBCD enzyme subunit RecC n=1 Tax=Shewanella corallii TaxID=560080 RepID=A0ABT0N8Y3_9GAMM|nr:exodeoxyribonuclease V subunit gamma [Shewanella corallii]MCL2914869.1 exodeoxyribonuclease V subunit gamma [Shewanella corallii]
MLHHIQSNQMELLSEKLAQLLTIPSGASLLTQDQILVQSPGMSTWLRLEIAKHNGIAAAQEFPLPSSFIWKLCYWLLEGVPEENPFTKAAMTWKLMAILPGLTDRDNFAPLRHYLATAEGKRAEGKAADQQADELKLFQLAARIADIFDQYLVYRPDWILGWEANEQPIELSPEQNWQPELWRELVNYNNQALGQSHYHRANLHQALIDALQDPNHSLKGLPPRLFVFGISSMAPQTLDVLHALAGRMDVFMLSLSPCRHYWGDIVDPKARARMSLVYNEKKQLPELWESSLEVGNPLLANNGKMGREMLDLVLELEPDNLELHEFYQEPDYSSLLRGVQSDILEMETLGETLGPDASSYLNLHKRRILSPDDNSIALRSCHSPLREVETLHDHLLHMLKLNPDLHPRDIVVMLPDVAAYAPYIDAVFSAKHGDHYIPYAIADRGAAQESPLISSFLNLLGLDKSRFGLSEVLSVLEVPAVMARFNIADDELEQLKLWLNNAGVRWGRNQQASEQQGLPAFDKHSWAFGIRRMILGYALGDEEALYHGDLPLPGIEGQAAQSLGKLLNFIEALDSAREALCQDADALSRTTQLVELLDTFYLAQPQEDKVRDDLNEIRAAIDKFGNEVAQSGFNAPVSLRVINQWFNSALTESRVGQRYLAGSVNFCTLMPMRSIPFQLVCLLGMNDGVYPRVQYPVGFDLMAHHGARKGDRSRRMDDRYLFLEALLSARSQLYISYIGHSERDNSERIPSMLVSELVEYCQLCYRTDAFQPDNEVDENSGPGELAKAGNDAADALLEQLLVHLPLQPFDGRLYSDKGDNLPRSFAPQWCPVVTTAEPGHTAFVCQPLNNAEGIGLDELPASELELQALIRFYRSPAQYFCQRTLKVDLSLELEASEDDEPFELNNLERYQLQLWMIEDALKSDTGEISDSLIDRVRADGHLPMAPFDNLLLSQYRRDISYVVGRTRYMRGYEHEKPVPEPSPLDIDIQLQHTGQNGEQTLSLIGRIDEVYPKGLINFRPGTAKPKDLLRVYLRHLCLNAKGHNKASYLLDMGHFHAFAAIDADKAKGLLQQLCDLFFKGQAKPLPFMAKTSWALIEEVYKQEEQDMSGAILSLESVWVDDNGFGDGADPYNARLFQFPEDFTGSAQTDFAPLAMTILKPLISLHHTDKLSELANFVEGGQ